MSLSAESLHRLAAESGFRIEFLEKVDRLLQLLQALFSDPYLSGRLALKGGTALNLYHFRLPRLSVDIDLNYIGALERSTMMAERPELEQRIRAISGRQNLALVRAPTSHAGSKWTFRATLHSNGEPNSPGAEQMTGYTRPLQPFQLCFGNIPRKMPSRDDGDSCDVDSIFAMAEPSRRVILRTCRE